MSATGRIDVSSSASISIITFSHPSHNALPGHLLRQLTDTITEIGSDPQTKIILLQSGGDRTFCAGAHFDELLDIQTPEEGEAFFSGFANVINAIRTCPKLIICGVQGKAVGGGVGLAAAADYCMATEHAAIRLSELAIGIGPFVIAPPVIRKIGLSAFSQLTLSPSEWKSAEWAMEKGLFFKVCKDKLQMETFLHQYADEMSQYQENALRQIKKMLWEGTGHWSKLLHERAQISGELVLSEATQAALTKFRNKA